MRHTPPLIVISDTDKDYLDLMMELLTEEGYQVLIAESGASAYHLIRERCASMAILDIPIMTPDAPLRTLGMLRLDPTTKDIPVLICSTNVHLMREDIVRLREMGCRMLAKPFYLEEMLEKIHKLLSNMEQLEQLA